jgi:hypothetical protein
LEALKYAPFGAAKQQKQAKIKVQGSCVIRVKTNIMAKVHAATMKTVAIARPHHLIMYEIFVAGFYQG